MCSKIISLVVIIGVVVSHIQAVPVPEDVQILKYENDIAPEGSYKFAYEQSDGQRRDEEASVKTVGDNIQVLSVRGSYSFVGDDGVVYTVTYIADENGFQAFGDHLPKAPGPGGVNDDYLRAGGDGFRSVSSDAVPSSKYKNFKPSYISLINSGG